MKHYILAAKIAITLALILWLSGEFSHYELSKAWENIKPQYFLLALLSHFLAYGALFFRWKIILNSFHPVSSKSIFDSFYIGLFSNNFLPSSIGGDIVRATILYKQGISVQTLLLSSTIDRIIGISVTLLIVLVTSSSFALENNIHLISDSELHLLSLVLIGVIATVIVLLLLFNRSKTQKNGTIAKIRRTLVLIPKAFRNHPAQYLIAILLSLLSTLSIIVCYYYLSLSLGFTISITTLFIIVPISFIAASLPITIGGIGVRESVIVYLLSIFGIATEQGLLLSILFLLTLMIVTLPGGIFFWLEKKSLVSSKQE